MFLMRRIVALLFIICFFQTCCSYASNIEVIPTTQTYSSNQNRVWSGVFQLAWNDLYNINGNRVIFAGKTPDVVNQLNNREFSYLSMPKKDYYAIASKIKHSTKRGIQHNIKKRLNIKSDLIKQARFVPQNDRIVLYGALNKDINFVTMFDNLGTAKFGENQTANYFGVNNQTKSNYSDTVHVLFYKSPHDFAISLNTQGDDVIYLYKTSDNVTFQETYKEMLFKAERYYGDGKLSEIDTLMIPYIQFKAEQNFTDLENRLIYKASMKINSAMETIIFDMSNKGLEAQPDYQKVNMKKALEVCEVEPRKFLLDDTFVIFVRGKSLDKPYFALRVNDITQFQVPNL